MSLKPLSMLTQEEWSAVQRLKDAVNAHVHISRETRPDRTSPPFLGISLDTGGSPDNTLYDTRNDCVRHLVLKDPYVFPVRIGVQEISAKEAWCILGFAREAKTQGVAFHHEDPVMPQRSELLLPFLRRTR